MKNNITYYEGLSDDLKSRVRALRIQAKYKYKKSRWSVDKTFYYNVICNYNIAL